MGTDDSNTITDILVAQYGTDIELSWKIECITAKDADNIRLDIATEEFDEDLVKAFQNLWDTDKIEQVELVDVEINNSTINTDSQAYTLRVPVCSKILSCN